MNVAALSSFRRFIALRLAWQTYQSLRRRLEFQQRAALVWEVLQFAKHRGNVHGS